MTLVRTRAIDDPGDLLALAPAGASAWVRHGDGLVGWGEARRIPVRRGRGRFADADDQLRAWFSTLRVQREVEGPGTGPVAFASLTFDRDSEGSCLVVPRVVLGRRDGAAWLTVIGGDDPALPTPAPLPDPVRVRYAGASVSELAWLEAVADAAACIRSADALTKVVLARDLRVWASEPLDALTLARRLAQRFEDCWTFVVAGLVGATPELLVRRTGDQLESLVLAGSAARGRGPTEDQRVGQALLDSSKDRVEHEIARTSVVEIYDRLCTAVHADSEPSLLRLANVQHLATSVTGVLREPTSALSVAGALHPTAAVCGTPTPAALERIRRTEGMDRGRYAGPVGWVDADGNGELGIALRCAEVSATSARLFTGAGVVGESLPEAELEETRLKLRAMQSALEGTAP